MGFSDDLLTILFSYSGGYRRLRELARGDTRFHAGRRNREVSDNVLSVTLSRLKKKGLVTRKEGIWKITKKGTDYIENKKIQANRASKMVENRKRTKNMILAFDVPESERGKRNWLRDQLVVFGFEPIQQSVWFGPAPLPEDFIESLSNLDILKCVKFFKVSKEDLV